MEWGGCMTIDELIESYQNKKWSKELEDELANKLEVLLKEYLKQGYVKIVH